MFSLPFVVATAWAHGEVTPAVMDPASEAFAESTRLLDAVVVEIDESLDRWLPDRRVTEVSLSDGATTHLPRRPQSRRRRRALPADRRRRPRQADATARRGRRRAGGADDAEPVVESRRGRVVASGLTQPQLSQTPVAGMAMLQVGQTWPSTCGLVAAACPLAIAHGRDLGRQRGLPPSVGHHCTEGAVARQPLVGGMVVGVAHQLAAHVDDGLGVAGARRFRLALTHSADSSGSSRSAQTRATRSARRRPSSGRAGWSGCRSAAAPARTAPGRSRAPCSDPPPRAGSRAPHRPRRRERPPCRSRRPPAAPRPSGRGRSSSPWSTMTSRPRSRSTSAAPCLPPSNSLDHRGLPVA